MFVKNIIARIKVRRRKRHSKGIPLYKLKMLTPEEEAERWKDYVLTDPERLRESAIDTVKHLEIFGKDYQRYWLKSFGEKHGINFDDIEI